MCEYCEGKMPLTDKVYEDGSKYDDRLSTRIGYLGKAPILISEFKKENFNWPIFQFMTEEQKEAFAQKWFVFINFCPICGNKLRSEKLVNEEI